jgi:hypothetical protein
VFGALENTGAALLARRASDAGVWKENGHRSPASWVADQMGSTLGEAINVLETAGRLEALRHTADALRSGTLSGKAAKEIAGAAAVDPGRNARSWS